MIAEKDTSWKCDFQVPLFFVDRFIEIRVSHICAWNWNEYIAVSHLVFFWLQSNVLWCEAKIGINCFSLDFAKMVFFCLYSEYAMTSSTKLMLCNHFLNRYMSQSIKGCSDSTRKLEFRWKIKHKAENAKIGIVWILVIHFAKSNLLCRQWEFSPLSFRRFRFCEWGFQTDAIFCKIWRQQLKTARGFKEIQVLLWICPKNQTFPFSVLRLSFGRSSRKNSVRLYVLSHQFSAKILKVLDLLYEQHLSWDQR